MEYQDEWYKKTKRKLENWILSGYWDLIDLTDLEYATVVAITTSKKYDDIAFRFKISFAESIVKNIKEKLDYAKKNCKKRKKEKEIEL